MNDSSYNLDSEYKKCCSLLQMSRLDLLQEKATQLIANFPDSDLGYEMLARSCVGQNQFDDALHHIETAINIVPNNSEYFRLHAVTLRFSNRQEEALTSIQEAIRLSPDHSELHCEWGLILTTMNKHSEALEKLHQALRLDGQNTMALAAIGDIHLHQEEWTAAEQKYREYLEIEPNSADVLNNLGFALFQQNRSDAATVAYRTALSCDPTMKQAKVNLEVVVRERLLKTAVIVVSIGFGLFYVSFKAGNMYPDTNRGYILLGGVLLLLISVLIGAVIVRFKKFQLGRSDPQLIQIYENIRNDPTLQKKKRKSG